jgi:hypothetical protein
MPVEHSSPDPSARRDAGAGAPFPSGSPPPVGLPQLGRGRHAVPEEGACLMEYTSVLAGLRFTDRPRCTAPTLAGLARLVNDASSDAARPELARLAPELSVRRHLSAEQSARVVAGVLTSVADSVEFLGEGRPGDQRRVDRLRRQAGRELARATAAGSVEWAPWVRAVEALHRNGAARLRIERAVRALSVLDVPARDRVLAAVLADALQRSRPVEASAEQTAGAPVVRETVPDAV